MIEGLIGLALLAIVWIAIYIFVSKCLENASK